MIEAPPAGAPCKPAAENIRQIAELEEQLTRQSSASERVGLSVTRVAGSLGFVLLHLVAYAIWILWNVLAPPTRRFDPFPFGVLTLWVSLEGVLLATFILMAQNRMSRQSDRRNQLNLQVSVLAEQEMTLVLRRLHDIVEHLGVGGERHDDHRARELMADTDVHELAGEIDRVMPDT